MSALVWIVVASIATLGFALLMNVIAEDNLENAWYQFRTSTFGLAVGMIVGLLVGSTGVVLSLFGSPDVLVGFLAMLGLTGSVEIPATVFLLVIVGITLVARYRNRMGA